MSEALLAVARALEYPAPESAEELRFALERLGGEAAPISGALEELAAYLAGAPEGEAEERYTALFDLSPVCTLHAGYHLFGEAYQRGELLAGLAGELRKAGLSGGLDLPDFLPTLLRLVARLPQEERSTLVDAVLLPSLARMNAALAESSAPWAAVLKELPGVLAPMGGGETFPTVQALPAIREEALDA